MVAQHWWVAVTGASSGIGRALALEFARHGHSLLLCGRDAQGLATAAEECHRLGSREVRISNQDLATKDGLAQTCRDLAELPDLDVLVNNAGFTVHGPFSSTNINSERALVHLQLIAMVELSKVALSRIIRRPAHETRGGLLNVASVYSYTPVPYQSIYGACKVFMMSVHDAWSEELRGMGVRMTLLCPGTTRSSFRSRSGVTVRPDRGVDPAIVAHRAYADFMKGRRRSVPGLANRIFVGLAALLSWPQRARVMRYVNRARSMPH